MKRDARIGLAVVLVLGLAVTLLIGRALYKSGEHVASTEGENAAGDAALPYGGEVRRVEGAETGNTAANMATPANNVGTGAAAAVNTASEQNNAGVQKFIAGQTSQATSPRPATGTPTTPPAQADAQPATGNNNNTVPPAKGNKPSVDDALLLDHERASPPPAAGSEPDFFGYTVAPGDNGWKIAFKVYGDGKYTQKILDANPGLHADKLKAGTLIKIPAIAHKTILLRLPSYAEAVKGGSKSGPAVANTTKKTAAKEEPAEANKTVKADTQGPTEAQTHKVEAGETLASIAKKYYGSSGPKTLAKIVAANKGLDPNKLKVGQELAIPAQ